MKICIYGNPTIDYIRDKDGNTRFAYGGGVYYSSLPFLQRGYHVEVYSVYSPMIVKHPITSHIVKQQYSARTNIFILDYTRFSRSILVLEKSDNLYHWNIHSGECMSIVNPVLGEIDISLLKLIRTKSSTLSVDAQGFLRETRSNIVRLVYEPAVLSLFEIADVVHMDKEEFNVLFTHVGKHLFYNLAKRLRGVLVVTDRPNKVMVFSKSNLREISFGDGVFFEHKTGAGDYFLSSYIIHYMKFMDEEEAVYQAHEETSRWLSTRLQEVSSHPHHSAHHQTPQS